MQAFVVEIYWPGVTEGLARELASRVRQVAEAARREGTVVRYLGCTLSPTDEVCFVTDRGSVEGGGHRRRGPCPPGGSTHLRGHRRRGRVMLLDSPQRGGAIAVRSP